MTRNDEFVVVIDDGVWLRDAGGFPACTLVIAEAKNFVKFNDAKICVNELRKKHKLFNAKVSRLN